MGTPPFPPLRPSSPVVPSPYLRRTNLVPASLHPRVSPKAKSELEATDVSGW